MLNLPQGITPVNLKTVDMPPPTRQPETAVLPERHHKITETVMDKPPVTVDGLAEKKERYSWLSSVYNKIANYATSLKKIIGEDGLSKLKEKIGLKDDELDKKETVVGKVFKWVGKFKEAVGSKLEKAGKETIKEAAKDIDRGEDKIAVSNILDDKSERKAAVAKEDMAKGSRLSQEAKEKLAYSKALSEKTDKLLVKAKENLEQTRKASQKKEFLETTGEKPKGEAEKFKVSSQQNLELANKLQNISDEHATKSKELSQKAVSIKERIAELREKADLQLTKAKSLAVSGEKDKLSSLNRFQKLISQNITGTKTQGMESKLLQKMDDKYYGEMKQKLSREKFTDSQAMQRKAEEFANEVEQNKGKADEHKSSYQNKLEQAKKLRATNNPQNIKLAENLEQQAATDKGKAEYFNAVAETGKKYHRQAVSISKYQTEEGVTILKDSARLFKGSDEKLTKKDDFQDRSSKNELARLIEETKGHSDKGTLSSQLHGDTIEGASSDSKLIEELQEKYHEISKQVEFHSTRSREALEEKSMKISDSEKERFKVNLMLDEANRIQEKVLQADKSRQSFSKLAYDEENKALLLQDRASQMQIEAEQNFKDSETIIGRSKSDIIKSKLYDNLSNIYSSSGEITKDLGMLELNKGVDLFSSGQRFTMIGGKLYRKGNELLEVA